MSSVDFFHKEYKTSEAGFPDLLRYESVRFRDVILGKGGELIATFSYRGPDLQCAEQAELDFLRSRVADMIKRLGSGWMIHSTTLRKSSMEYEHAGEFPDQVTRAIENERIRQYREEGSHFENEYYLTFTYLPDDLLVGKVKAFAFDGDNMARMTPAQHAEKSVRFFERELKNLVDMLESGLGSKLTRLGARQERDPMTQRMVWFDDQLAFIHQCITAESNPIRLPAQLVPVGVDFLLGSYPFLTGIRPKLNGKNIRVVAIESPPDSGTSFGILEVLNRVSVEFRWTTRWIARDTEKTKAEVQKVRSKWRQKIRGFVADVMGRTGGAINQDAANMALDAEAVLTDLESGVVSYGSWTSTVVLMDNDAAFLETSVQFLLKTIGALGFVCRDEEVNCTEAFLGSLPGHGYDNVRRAQIHSMNLADCLPLTSVWQGPVSNPCSFYKKKYATGVVPPLFQGAASGGTPFRVVLHNGDVGHTFIAGPTGAGKSTLLGLIAQSHMRYPGAQFFAFEKGESMLALCLGAGGSHYNFMDDASAASKGIRFAPFDKIERMSDRMWACDYVETILILNDVKVDHDMRSEIRSAMDLLATRPQRSFTHFNQLIQVNTIKKVLAPYEKESSGGMLNGLQDTIAASKFTVFEMEKLMELNDRHVVPILLYIFRLIERNLDGSPTIILLDEAWLMLQHPMFEEKLKEWLKVIRKSNGLIVFATQELQDVAKCAIASTIFSACQTKIMCPNAAAAMPENAALYRSIGLTDREIELLTVAIPKRDYFFTSPAGRRMFQLELRVVALAFLAASGIEDRKAIKELYEMYGHEWVPYWLKRQGVSASVLGERLQVVDMA